MYECLKIFDEQLAISEAALASTIASTSPPIKRKKKISPVLVEGLEIKEPQWALIDGGKAVIHIMTSKARKTWQVEGVASAFSEVNRERDRIGEEEEYDDESDIDLESDEAGQNEDHHVGSKKTEFQPRM